MLYPASIEARLKAELAITANNMHQNSEARAALTSLRLLKSTEKSTGTYMWKKRITPIPILTGTGTLTTAMDIFPNWHIKHLVRL